MVIPNNVMSMVRPESIVDNVIFISLYQTMCDNNVRMGYTNVWCLLLCFEFLKSEIDFLSITLETF